MPIIKHTNRARRREQNRQADLHRGSARERGYSTQWDKFARSWLETHPLCLYCASQGRTTPAALVDHIIPHNGDPERFWPPDGVNPEYFFAAACTECHNGPKQASERAASRFGKDVRSVLIRKGMLPKDFPVIPLFG